MCLDSDWIFCSNNFFKSKAAWGSLIILFALDLIGIDGVYVYKDFPLEHIQLSDRYIILFIPQRPLSLAFPIIFDISSGNIFFKTKNE